MPPVSQCRVRHLGSLFGQITTPIGCIGSDTAENEPAKTFQKKNVFAKTCKMLPMLLILLTDKQRWAALVPFDVVGGPAAQRVEVGRVREAPEEAHADLGRRGGVLARWR